MVRALRHVLPLYKHRALLSKPLNCRGERLQGYFQDKGEVLLRLIGMLSYTMSKR